MKISPDSWHYRLYSFMSQWNAAWREKDDFLDYPKHGTMIGLCPYMRMILIWGPLAILSNLIPIAAVIGAFLLFPASVNGGAAVGWLFFTVIAFVGIILALGWLKNYLDERHEENEVSQLHKQDPDYVEPDSFWKLLKGYAKAVKSRVCPVLELEE